MNRRRTIVLAAIAAATVFVPAERADYAVLRSGLRIHVTGYEDTGDRVRLTVPGGVVEVAAGDLLSVEPEDTFQTIPAPPAPDAAIPYSDLIRAAAEKHGVDEKLITRVIAAESNFNPK